MYRSRGASFLSRCPGTSASGRARGPGLHAPFVPKWRLRAPFTWARVCPAPRSEAAGCGGVPHGRGPACVLGAREWGRPGARGVECWLLVWSPWWGAWTRSLPCCAARCGTRGVGIAGCQHQGRRCTLLRSVCGYGRPGRGPARASVRWLPCFPRPLCGCRGPAFAASRRAVVLVIWARAPRWAVC